MSDFTFSTYDKIKGVCRPVIRDDAVPYRGRYVVPTTSETKWIGTWEEFRTAGGIVGFGESQCHVTLELPAPYKFGIGFPKG